MTTSGPTDAPSTASPLDAPIDADCVHGAAADRLACLHRIALALPSALDVPDVGRIFVYEGRAAMGSRAGALFLVAPGSQDASPACAAGPTPGAPPSREGTLAALSAAAEGVVVWPGESAGTDASADAPTAAPARPVVVAAPVVAEGRTVVGALVFEGLAGWRPDEDDRAMLLTLARLCGHALDHLAHREGELNAREEALRERAARARAEVGTARIEAILGSARHAIIECDTEGRIVFWSPGAEGIYGHSAAQALGQCMDILVPPDQEPQMADIERVLRMGDRVQGLQAVHQTADGRRITVCLDAAPLAGTDGEFRGSVWLADDTTGHRRAEEQRERLLQRLRSERAHMFAVVDELPAGVMMAEAPSGRIVLANREAARILRQEPLSAHNVDEYGKFHAFRPDGSPLAAGEFPLARALAHEEVARERELGIRCADGTIAFIVANAAPVRGPGGEVVAAVMAFVDISAHKQAEKELRASEQRFRAAIEHFPGGFVILDGKRRIQFANSAWCRLFRVHETQFARRRDEELFPAEVTRGYLPALRRAIGSGEPQSLEWTTPPSLGEGTFALTYVPLCDERGRARQVLGIAHDITARRRIEAALRASEGRFRALAEATPQMVWTTDPDGVCDYANRRWLEFTGMSLEETARRGLSAAAHEEDAPRAAAAWAAAVRDRAPYDCEFRMRHAATGSYRWFLTRALPVLDARGQVAKWFGTTTDVHDLREALAKIEVLNTRLRTGMRETHHRIKNNLQVVAALVDMQVLSGMETVPLAELERLGRHVRSLASVHDMLTEEAAAYGSADVLHLSGALDKLVPVLCGIAAGRHIEVQADDIPLALRLGTALVVLMNELVSNAVKHGQGAIVVSLKRRGDGAQLAVTDEGPGFPPDFDPRTAAHTGLELVEMVGRHDLRGTVSYRNGPGGGAHVTVDFPLDEPSRR